MLSILLEFWKHLAELLGVKLSTCAKFKSHHSEDEATRKREDELRVEFPNLFSEVP
jgi:hypothetical protein